MNDLTTYGALSCELAFLQSFAICFTLVDHSVEKIKYVVMPTLSQSIQGISESCDDKSAVGTPKEIPRIWNE